MNKRSANYTATISQDGALEFTDELEQWRKQQPVPLTRHQLNPIPPDTFDGGFLEAIVNELSGSLEAPIELAGFLGLAAIATVSAKRFSVLIEPGYFEPVNIWTAASMDPSNRKSAALKIMVEPLHNWERQQRKLQSPVINETRSQRKTLEKVIHDRRNKVSKINDPQERKAEIAAIAKLESELPEIQSLPQLMIDDCTPEAVARILKEQGERLAYVDSEADSLFAMMQGKYSDKPVLDVYLKSYSGDSIKVDRQSNEPTFLNHPLLTIGIAPQPGLIQDLVKKPILIQRGLLSRFLFSIPTSKVGYRDLQPRSVSEAAVQRYRSGLEYLLTIHSNQNDPGHGSPHIIRFSGDGYRVWKDWQREVEPMMRDDGRLCDPAIKAWCGKLAGNTARMAGLLHIAATAPQNRPNELEISRTTVERAVAACRALIDHAIAVHDLAVTDSDRSRAIHIFELLQDQGCDQVSIHDVHLKFKQRAAFQTADDVRAGFRVLTDNGWLYRAPKPSGPGRPPELFFVHPAISPQYSQNMSRISTVEHHDNTVDFVDVFPEADTIKVAAECANTRQPDHPTIEELNNRWPV